MGNQSITSFCNCKDSKPKEDYNIFPHYKDISNGNSDYNKSSETKRCTNNNQSKKSISLLSFEAALSDRSDFKSLIELETCRKLSELKNPIKSDFLKDKNNFFHEKLENSLYQGYGVLKQNDIIYSGYFDNGKKSGYGEITNILTEKVINKGEFKNDLKHGKGIEYSLDGSEYSGSFINNIREGLGILKYSNGTVYEGNFRQGEIQGHGKLIWSKDKYYSGEFSEGKLNGLGTFIQNKILFRGYYNNNKKDGLGHIIYLENNLNIVGTFKDDILNGYAISFDELKNEKRLFFLKGKQVDCFATSKEEEDKEYKRIKRFYNSSKIKLESKILKKNQLTIV